MKRWLVLLCLMLAAAPAHAVGARRTFVLFTGAATDTASVGMADSVSVANPNGIFPTENYERLYLLLKPNRPCRIAIQVRSHGFRDSSYTVGTMPDTNNTFVWPWRGPTTLTAAGGISPDSVTYHQDVLPTSVSASSEEAVVEYIAAGVSKWGGARGLVIPLRGTDGTWYWGRFTSIRLRVLTASGVVTFRASVQGVAW